MADLFNKDEFLGSKAGFTTSTADGTEYTFDVGAKDSTDGVVPRYTAAIINYYLKYGTYPDKSITGIDSSKRYNASLQNAKALLTEQGLTQDVVRQQIASSGGTVYNAYGEVDSTYMDAYNNGTVDTSTENAEDSAFNNYWNDIYSTEDGTLGGEAYQNLAQAEINSGQNAIDLANAQSQQLAMSQAQTVNDIVNQVKSERMSKLRAGMSESQIASQDMQTMLANTNALNQQAATSNLAALQGQQQINDAQTTAYNNWLNSMNTTATAASAMAAADAGDADLSARKYSKATGQSYANSMKAVTGK